MSDRNLFDSLLAALTEVGEGVAVVDLDTQRYVSVNAALVAMYGYTEEELLALPSFFALLPSDEVTSLEPALERRVSGEVLDADLYNTRVVRKDGETIEVEVSVKPLSSLPGNQMIALVRDVTLQRRREREVARAERRYRTLVERLPVVTYVAEPGEMGRWVYVSPQIESMFGYPAQQWI